VGTGWSGWSGAAPSRMVGVSASVSLPLHRKVQKFCSGTGSPEWSWKKGHKTVVVVWWLISFNCLIVCVRVIADTVFNY